MLPESTAAPANDNDSRGRLAGQGDPVAALQDIDRLLEVSPCDGPLLLKRGTLLAQLARHDEAIQVCRQLLAQLPEEPRATLLLATSLQARGLPSEAARLAETLRRRQPPEPAALPVLAAALVDLGLGSRILPTLRRVQLGPPMDLALGSLLLHVLQHLPQITEGDFLQEACCWGQRARAEAIRRLGVIPSRPVARSAVRRPLRVGYLSPPLRHPPLGLTLLALLQAHDPAQVTPFLYGCGPAAEGVTADPVAAAAALGGRLVNVQDLDDPALAQRIAGDAIDVLIDLGGHQSPSRLAVCAARPAPLQLSWSEVPATTGLAAIDAVILDALLAPEGRDVGFVESILRLPHNRLCFAPPQDAASPPPGSSQRSGPLRFGCFHDGSSLHPELLRCWAALLRAVPSSRLLLQNRTLEDPVLARDLRAFFGQQGIAEPGRLELRCPTETASRLAQYAEVDIVLDPFPLSGGHLALEALWMGVPVLCLAGRRVVSRQCQALLTLLGLEQDLVAADPQEYVRKGVALAADPARLQRWRRELRQRLEASPLMDSSGFCRDFEALIRRCWNERIEPTAVPAPSAGHSPAPPAPGTPAEPGRPTARQRGPWPDNAADPPLIVMAPPYRASSAGIWVLHLLTHTFNQLGIPCFLQPTREVAEPSNPAFVTPLAAGLPPRLRQQAIVIYPDVITDNPLGAGRVVRYMLYFDGASGRRVQAGPHDFFVAFARMFKPDARALLYHPISDPSLFHARGSLHPCERSLDLFYVGKGSRFGPCPVIPGAIELASGWPARKEELATLLRCCRYLYSYDTVSSVCTDAALCGAIPVLLRDQPIPRLQLRQEPVATPFILELSARELADYAQRQADYTAMVIQAAEDFPQRVLQLHHQLIAHFAGVAPDVGGPPAA
ncbi:MAG: tetratricopeptide repeat protein [Synechococcaceae cyanobacterium]|nr:tetratricopeptide repeat protein [Synechococcaceae cyanobacterium]